MAEAPSTMVKNSCPNPKCSEISFPRDTVIVIHELPSLENEDPRLTEMFSKMRPPGMPKYGLGYLEHTDDLIPSYWLQDPVPNDFKKPSKREMYKFFTIMEVLQRTKWT